jgi:hypothetical protein
MLSGARMFAPELVQVVIEDTHLLGSRLFE